MGIENKFEDSDGYLVTNKKRRTALFINKRGIRKPVLEVYFLKLADIGSNKDINNYKLIGIDYYRGNLVAATIEAYREWKENSDSQIEREKTGRRDLIR